MLKLGNVILPHLLDPWHVLSLPIKWWLLSETDENKTYVETKSKYGYFMALEKR